MQKHQADDQRKVKYEGKLPKDYRQKVTPVIFLFNPTMDGHGVVIIVNLIRDLGGHPEPYSKLTLVTMGLRVTHGPRSAPDAAVPGLQCWGAPAHALAPPPLTHLLL